MADPCGTQLQTFDNYNIVNYMRRPPKIADYESITIITIIIQYILIY